MKFLTQAIKFMPATGRGSSFRLAEHQRADDPPHRFVVVFDEDMDMRVTTFLKHLLDRPACLAHRNLQVVGERKGHITLVFKPEPTFDITQYVKEEVARARELAGEELQDDWSNDVYVSFSDPALWNSLFYPLGNPKETKAAVFAALQIAKNLKTTEVLTNDNI